MSVLLLSLFAFMVITGQVHTVAATLRYVVTGEVPSPFSGIAACCRMRRFQEKYFDIAKNFLCKDVVEGHYKGGNVST